MADKELVLFLQLSYLADQHRRHYRWPQIALDSKETSRNGRCKPEVEICRRMQKTVEAPRVQEVDSASQWTEGRVGKRGRPRRRATFAPVWGQLAEGTYRCPRPAASDGGGAQQQ